MTASTKQVLLALWYRVRLAFAALIMLAAFWAILRFGVYLVIVFIVGYVVTGSEWLRKHITAFGQGLDSAANVVLLDGNPKETISSHVGRMYSAKYGSPEKGMPIADPDYKLPWQAIVVYHFTNLGEPRHVYNAVEQWAVDAKISL